MTEIFIVLSLFSALVWGVVHTALVLIRPVAADDIPSHRGDPIATYVEENYGSHFVEDPITVNQTLRNL